MTTGTVPSSCRSGTAAVYNHLVFYFLLYIFCRLSICVYCLTEPLKLCSDEASVTTCRCRCRQGWTGVRCDQCRRKPGCQHGYCVTPWQCICDRGWTGTYCNHGTLSTLVCVLLVGGGVGATE